MKLKETLENHPLIILAVVFTAGVSLAWAVALQVLVGPRDFEIQQLKDRIAAMDSKLGPTEMRSLKESVVTNNLAITQDTSSTNTELDETVFEGILKADNPYPKGYDGVKLGMSLSILKRVYPSAEYSPAWGTWSVDLQNGPFKFVRYSLSNKTDESDPRVSWLEFMFRDEVAKKKITEEALKVFDVDQIKSTMLGEELEWPNINGFRIGIDPVRYSLSLAEEL